MHVTSSLGIFEEMASGTRFHFLCWEFLSPSHALGWFNTSRRQVRLSDPQWRPSECRGRQCGRVRGDRGPSRSTTRRGYVVTLLPTILFLLYHKRKNPPWSSAVSSFQKSVRALAMTFACQNSERNSRATLRCVAASTCKPSTAACCTPA